MPAGKGMASRAKREHNRPETAAVSLARVKPDSCNEGTITAGNEPD